MSPADTNNRRVRASPANAERAQLTGIPASTWRVMQDENTAPKPYRLSKRNVGWLRSELLAWCEARVAERDGGRAHDAA